jgi:tetratricopeptide (TPR) repeat protein
LLDKQNPNNLSTPTYYKTADQAVAAVNAVYATLQNAGLYNNQYFLLTDLTSDDMRPTPKLPAAEREYYNFNYTASSGNHSALWSALYQGVFRANTVLERVPAVPMDDKLKNRVLGEARFLRAYYYFTLVQNFGRVPLVTKVLTAAEASVPRAPVDDVYALVIEDLQFAEANLPRRSEYARVDVGRATSGAAKGMLGKVYLFRRQWAEAAAKFAEVIDSKEYSLVADFRDNGSEKNENNAESLFEVQFEINLGAFWSVDQPGNGEMTFRAAQYGVPGFTPFGNGLPSLELINAFEKGDPRFEKTFYGPYTLVNGAPLDTTGFGYAWRKYQHDEVVAGKKQEDVQSEINMRVLRYADVLLMHAEALNELGRTAEAATFLNQVRKRADPSGTILLPRDPAVSPVQMTEWIRQERRVELAGEQIRKFDLIRWGIADQALGKRGFTRGKNELFPIPQTEIDVNPALQGDQNNGF